MRWSRRTIIHGLESPRCAAHRQRWADNLHDMENLVARMIGLGLAFVGVAFLSVYPVTRRADARERADIDRALAPLVSVPLDELQAPNGRTVDVTIPSDDQWKRITTRLGSPSFLVVTASAKGE